MSNLSLDVDLEAKNAVYREERKRMAAKKQLNKEQRALRVKALRDEKKLMKTTIPAEKLKEAKLPVGRPKANTGRLAELKQRLLASSGPVIIDKVLSIAVDDNHPGQMAAMKMCIDRMLPLSMFENKLGDKPQIQINIVNTTDRSSDVEVINAEDVEDIETIDNE